MNIKKLNLNCSYLTRSPQMPLGMSECIQYSLLGSWVLGALLTVIFTAVMARSRSTFAPEKLVVEMSKDVKRLFLISAL